MTVHISQADARQIARELLDDTARGWQCVEVSADGRAVIFRYDANPDPNNRAKMIYYGYRFSRDAATGDLHTARGWKLLDEPQPVGWDLRKNYNPARVYLPF